MTPLFHGPRSYGASPRHREPLIKFMIDALEGAGCRIIHRPKPNRAPFVITFETRSGERMGVVAYAYLATRTLTPKRPKDERSFQVKYGGKRDNSLHQIWQDPLGLFTTIFVGISPSRGYFVAVDPEVHNPTKLFIRIEYKDEHADEIARNGWFAWERRRITKKKYEDPVEVLVGGTAEHFLDLIRFERAAQGLDPGNRHLLAQRPDLFAGTPATNAQEIAAEEIAHHPLAEELDLSPDELMDVIQGARRLKMAVRGWVAERHLLRELSRTPGITHCERIDEEGGPDLRVRLNNGPVLTVECKNVLRQTYSDGTPRLDFQRTRASKKNPCSRYYSASDFDVVAACLHAVTEKWEFRYIQPKLLREHDECSGKLANNLRVDKLWHDDPIPVLQAAGAGT